jgi:hypothetical protein
MSSGVFICLFYMYSAGPVARLFKTLWLRFRMGSSIVCDMREMYEFSEVSMPSCLVSLSSSA